ncbi:MAG: DJ-1/PfpI family protein [Lentisphaerae bacterium]|nr:DJ-1/PfpI family protein [Lentisphaerota bacterium]
MTTSVLVPLADGTEELEAVAVIDTLRRAGWRVVVAGLTGRTVTCSRGVRILPDVPWEEVAPDEFDVLVLPGGAAGTKTMEESESVVRIVREFDRAGKTVAAICAAPLVLQAAGILSGRRITCHPSVEGMLKGVELTGTRVAVDGHVLTSQGAGTAVEFALAVIEHTDGPAAAERVRAGMVA